jgi:hypothetical protein
MLNHFKHEYKTFKQSTHHNDNRGCKSDLTAGISWGLISRSFIISSQRWKIRYGTSQLFTFLRPQNPRGLDQLPADFPHLITHTYPVSYILFQSLSHSVYMSTDSNMTFFSKRCFGVRNGTGGKQQQEAVKSLEQHWNPQEFLLWSQWLPLFHSLKT